MKKLAIFGLAMMLVFGMSVVSMAAFDIQTGAPEDVVEPSVDVGIDLQVNKSASISAPDDVEVVMHGGESWGQASGSYTVSANFDYTINATLNNTTNMPMVYSIDSGTVNKDATGAVSLTNGSATVNDPATISKTYDFVVGIDQFDDDNGVFHDPAYSTAGDYTDIATLTLTVQAQP